MAEFKQPVRPDYPSQKPSALPEPPYRPYWERSPVQYAQDLLGYSEDPIEYDHNDRDYWDNCFFFPEDCSWSPPIDWVIEEHISSSSSNTGPEACHEPSTDNTIAMIPGLPDIKMLDAEALSDLLEDNLSPPEITSIIVFSTNGAIFAYASTLSSRQLRNLSATYGAAYTCYAKNASTGNLTGVNPASHPSSYVTTPSVSLGDVGSIVFQLDDSVAVVTPIADKVLLAAIGPSKLGSNSAQDASASTTNGHTHATPNGSTHHHHHHHHASGANTPDSTSNNTHNVRTYASVVSSNTGGGRSNGASAPGGGGGGGGDTSDTQTDSHLETQYEIDRSSDLARLATLNLSASPEILLALESKSAALGRFLSQKLEDLESPEDF
ncbi:hypothetical protein ASPACDRAFT_41197 [Aspergillus aculeatus ATCC 16872]|uniref:Uncharacterized protein n=1 Tax=Aspergillus aculeatus (strain ATCC 16872 / CBS 172.66 / WB 5094) TaxID=690307 RepID=A0A1L9X1Q4_ASPA1|nr:uncharacterized protein ASPACDRAFT_41197 [Aspergillus aculeatus ATCC 16872]OJK02373.1 hypothetical protein ASPACDRAFT_41197 [Aspergillus aculeatus ATCC 16872]